MITSLLSTYTAGFLTSLTPCVYPMIPLSLGYLGSQQTGLKKSTVIAFSLGQILTFSLMGLVAVQLGEVFGFLSESKALQITMGILLLIFAYYSWSEKLPQFMTKMSSVSSSAKKPKGVFTSFFAGCLSTLVASPCSTPVLAGVLVMIAQTESQARGVLLMLMYGFGLSTLFLILGLGLLRAQTLPRSGQWMRTVHKLSVILLIVGAGYFFGKALGLL